MSTKRFHLVHHLKTPLFLVRLSLILLFLGIFFPSLHVAYAEDAFISFLDDEDIEKELETSDNQTVIDTKILNNDTKSISVNVTIESLDAVNIKYESVTYNLSTLIHVFHFLNIG